MSIDNLLTESDRFIIEHAVGRLSNTLRIFGEEHMRFRRLAEVDKEEAINNYDRAFELILESFHTLYDVSKKYFNFFDVFFSSGNEDFFKKIHADIYFPKFFFEYGKLFLDDTKAYLSLAHMP